MANNEKLTKEQMEALKFSENLERMRQYAKALDDTFQLSDLASSNTKTWTVFSKDSLRSYLQNPYSANCRVSISSLVNVSMSAICISPSFL